MSEWISRQDVISRLGHKLLIVGLSEAGKTAIKKIFFENRSAEDVIDLQATLNYERLTTSIQGINLTILDLGGQERYIKYFLERISSFVFSSVNTFIFVIDMANKKEKTASVQYFKQCATALERFSNDVKYFVFLHKNDLVINSPDYDTLHYQLKKEFQQFSNKKITFFRTTIFSKNTIRYSLHYIFSRAYPDKVLIDQHGLEDSEFNEEFLEESLDLIHDDFTSLKTSDENKSVQSDIKTQPTNQLHNTKVKMAGDPKLLQNLESLLNTALKTQNKGDNEEIIHPASTLTSKDREKVTKLQNLITNALKK